jgi:hypothetical protein
MISRAFQEIDAEYVETLREDTVVVGNIERWQRQDLERTGTRIFRRHHQRRADRDFPCTSGAGVRGSALLVGECVSQPNASERDYGATAKIGKLHCGFPGVSSPSGLVWTERLQRLRVIACNAGRFVVASSSLRSGARIRQSLRANFPHADLPLAANHNARPRAARHCAWESPRTHNL